MSQKRQNKQMIRATIKFILLIISIAISVFFLWIAKLSGKKHWFNRVRSFGCASINFIVGLRIKTIGEVSQNRPLLLVSNHISYLDILILGQKTNARFTPKSEMASWPILSTICKLQDCIFIDRRSDKIKENSDNIINSLAKNVIISIFPEGTTGNGKHLLPYKSSFFSIAETPIEGEELWVQAAVINYTHIGSLPIDNSQWPSIAWYGDMVLLPHLWELLKLRKIDATLTFLPAVTSKHIGNRKKLANHCYQITRECLEK